jgi:isochorismate synthase
MFISLMQMVKKQLDDNLPFVVYKRPKTSKIQAVFQNDDQLHLLKDFSETGFIFAPFDSKENTILIPYDRLDAVSIDREKISLRTSKPSNSDVAQKVFHCNLVDKGIKEIANGKLKKVVLSRKLVVECTASSIELFERLMITYDNALCYLWHHPKVGTWLGATPEMLLNVENNQLTTMSLAGTLKHEDEKTAEWGRKELDEQHMVTSFIVKALEGKVGELKVFPTETIKAGNLLHLRTKLKSSLKTGGLSDVLSALHPTPAVCGMPMSKAKEFILENENYDREFYTGYLGELNFKSEKPRTSRRKNQENTVYKSIKSTTTLFVNLRCMQLIAGKAFIYVGGGVTKDSDPEKEWHETVAKSKTILQVLG